MDFLPKGFGRLGCFSKIIAIAAGKNHGIALDKQGWIWVWGASGDGHLGLGDSDDRDTPTLIPRGPPDTVVAPIPA